jgi:hypothetical protein
MWMIAVGEALYPMEVSCHLLYKNPRSLYNNLKFFLPTFLYHTDEVCIICTNNFGFHGT